MLKLKTRFDVNPKPILVRMDRATAKSLRSAGAWIRAVARNKIGKPKPISQRSKPGASPFTHTGALRNAIIYGLGKYSVVIGPARNLFSLLGETHEFGGRERRSAKTRKARPVNWRLAIGGHGPVAFNGGIITFAKLRSHSQVRRSQQVSVAALIAMDKERRDAEAIGKTLVADPNAQKTKMDADYPARPFMGPALAVSRSKLPSFFQDKMEE